MPSCIPKRAAYTRLNCGGGNPFVHGLPHACSTAVGPYVFVHTAFNGADDVSTRTYSGNSTQGWFRTTSVRRYRTTVRL